MPDAPTTASIRAAIGRGERGEAERLLRELLRALARREVGKVAINADPYSLNSVNGFAEISGLGECFFKFHQEEGEARSIAEYYNAQALEQAGYPVDMPILAGTRPGSQILVYRRRGDRRLFDVCFDIETGAGGSDAESVVAAQQRADEQFARIALETLHKASGEQIAAEPIFQLFHHRLVDDPLGAPDGALGGRFAQYYRTARIAWPGLSTDYAGIAHCHWRINGIPYHISLAEAFLTAKRLLHPQRLAFGPAYTAHGDAHNANVWFVEQGDGSQLTLFDPAFAGRHVPALLGEVKASFHNIFAHPFWLYSPAHCARAFGAQVQLRDGELQVETDFQLSDLRLAFLESKAERFWRPLVARLRAAGWLIGDWQATVRSALFCCPTLVMNLLADDRDPVSSLIGFSQAIKAAVAPADKTEDDFQRFFELIG